MFNDPDSEQIKREGLKTLNNIKKKFKGYDKFNKKQNRVLLIGVCVIIFLFIFPPWQASNANGNTASVGHGMILFPPSEYRIPSLDLVRLFVEMLGVIFISGVGIFITRDDEEEGT